MIPQLAYMAGLCARLRQRNGKSQLDASALLRKNCGNGAAADLERAGAKSPDRLGGGITPVLPRHTDVQFGFRRFTK